MFIWLSYFRLQLAIEWLLSGCDPHLNQVGTENMGQAKDKAARRLQFFKDHPYCCFCGGGEVAETEDHQPARYFFRQKHWPEGYSFPACISCNKASSKNESLVALLVRMNERETTDIDKVELQNIFRQVTKDFPDFLSSMRLRRVETRHILRKYHFPLAEGQFLNDVPIVRVPHVGVTALENVSFKIGCALHYKHLGKILPLHGIMLFSVATNLTVREDNYLEEMVKMASGFSITARSRIDLRDQFSYFYGLDANSEFGLFICKFRESVVLTIATLGNFKAADLTNEAWSSGFSVGDHLRKFRLEQT